MDVYAREADVSTGSIHGLERENKSIRVKMHPLFKSQCQKRRTNSSNNKGQNGIKNQSGADEIAAGRIFVLIQADGI